MKIHVRKLVKTNMNMMEIVTQLVKKQREMLL